MNFRGLVRSHNPHELRDAADSMQGFILAAPTTVSHATTTPDVHAYPSTPTSRCQRLSSLISCGEFTY